MTWRTRFEASINKRAALTAAEEAGEVADSHAVRLALMARVKSGELTLAEAQKELASIRRNAKAAGKITRAQAFNRG